MIVIPSEGGSNVGHGLFWIMWKDGDRASLAAVGSDHAGRRWFAPTNWIRVPGYDWSVVDYVVPIETGKRLTRAEKPR